MVVSQQIQSPSGFLAPVDRVDKLPGPPAMPLVGNLLEFFRRPPHVALEEWAKRYGSVFQYKLGATRLIGVAEHGLISAILKARPGSFSRHRKLKTTIEETGFRGVFTAEGERWKRHRRLVMKGLTPAVVHRAYPNIQTVTGRLQQHWERVAAKARQRMLQPT